MKRTFYISVLLMLSCLPMAAQLNGTGYYRFRNAQNTSDYISIANDLFNYHIIASNAGGGLTQLALSSAAKQRALACAGKYLQTDIHLVEDADIVNMGSIVYAKKRNNNSTNYDYNLIGQGTSLLSLTTGTYAGTIPVEFQDRYATIKATSGSGANTLYTAMVELKASNNSAANLGTRYLIDNGGTLDINESSSANNAKWYIEPVAYFNVQPDITFNDKSYTTVYVPFEFQLSGAVEKAYVVTSISDDGTLELETVCEQNAGSVPAGTPVILECGSDQTTDCKLIPIGEPLFCAPDLTVTSGGAPRASTTTNYSGINLLKGNYYCNTDGNISYTTRNGTSSFNANHYTATSSSNYVLGITASGKLGMVKSTDVITGGNPNAMPANKAWIEYSGSAELVFPFTASIRGDVNRDGIVDVDDVSALVNIIQDRDPDFDYDYDAADLDGNGEYDVDDVTGIVNIIQGRE